MLNSRHLLETNLRSEAVGILLVGVITLSPWHKNAGKVPGRWSEVSWSGFCSLNAKFPQLNPLSLIFPIPQKGVTILITSDSSFPQVTCWSFLFPPVTASVQAPEHLHLLLVSLHPISHITYRQSTFHSTALQPDPLFKYLLRNSRAKFLLLVFKVL